MGGFKKADKPNYKRISWLL